MFCMEYLLLYNFLKPTMYYCPPNAVRRLPRLDPLIQNTYNKTTMIEKVGFVYILASQKRGTLYVGVTSDLKKRIQEHKTKTYTGFTEKYDVTLLIWYEVFDSLVSALEAEKK